MLPDRVAGPIKLVDRPHQQNPRLDVPLAPQLELAELNHPNRKPNHRVNAFHQSRMVCGPGHAFSLCADVLGLTRNQLQPFSADFSAMCRFAKPTSFLAPVKQTHASPSAQASEQ